MKFKILGRQFQVSMTIGPRSHPGEQQVFREPSNKPFDKHDIQAALQMARLMGQSRGSHQSGNGPGRAPPGRRHVDREPGLSRWPASRAPGTIGVRRNAGVPSRPG